VVLESCEGPAGIVQLPSRDDIDDADCVVSDESLELVWSGRASAVVGEDASGSGSSVSVFVQESRESLEGAVGGRSSKASCSSN